MTLRPALAVLLAATLLVSVPALAQTVRIGAGAGYKRVFAEIDAAFTRSSGLAVEETYGNLGQVVATARTGGRMDVVFGDLNFLKGVPGFEAGRFVDVGRGRLVVAWAKGVALNGPMGLTGPGIGRIAVPDGKNAVYGKAGLEFLSRAGLLTEVRPRLLTVGSVPQVTAYLVSGEVDAGLLNLTDALAVKDRIGGFAEVDQEFYDPIRITGAVLPGADRRPEVARYLEFMGGPEARAIVDKHGL